MNDRQSFLLYFEKNNIIIDRIITKKTLMIDRDKLDESDIILKENDKIYMGKSFTNYFDFSYYCYIKKIEKDKQLKDKSKLILHKITKIEIPINKRKLKEFSENNELLNIEMKQKTLMKIARNDNKCIRIALNKYKEYLERMEKEIIENPLLNITRSINTKRIPILIIPCKQLRTNIIKVVNTHEIYLDDKIILKEIIQHYCGCGKCEKVNNNKVEPYKIFDSCLEHIKLKVIKNEETICKKMSIYYSTKKTWSSSNCMYVIRNKQHTYNNSLLFFWRMKNYEN